ncbi:hypothetical protein [Rummeliibacillus pycnus]|uniref:hypothetical protein n=1 Tax=Rummeliibacillus pycnus TaxID=101070 RepID=UPI0011AEDE60|nr:hypothetical protein [Rummeliibacillus pycnus]
MSITLLFSFKLLFTISLFRISLPILITPIMISNIEMINKACPIPGTNNVTVDNGTTIVTSYNIKSGSKKLNTSKNNTLTIFLKEFTLRFCCLNNLYIEKDMNAIATKIIPSKMI